MNDVRDGNRCCERGKSYYWLSEVICVKSSLHPNVSAYAHAINAGGCAVKYEPGGRRHFPLRSGSPRFRLIYAEANFLKSRVVNVTRSQR